jgi:hypothetical protein
VILRERQRDGHASPSHRASSEHSGPLRRSSRTNGPIGDVVGWPLASLVADSGTITPLPAARPSSFTTTG